MGWRSWTLTKVAVFGVCFGATFVLLAAAVVYFYNRPKAWDAKALAVQWTDVKYLVGDNKQINGFLFEYGVSNNTDKDYELHKEGTTIMTNPSDRKDSLIPADFNYSIGRDTFFLPAHQTSLIELHFDGGCSTFGDTQVFDWFERNAPGRKQEKAYISDGPVDEKERARKCFERYIEDLNGIVLFDQTAKYRINLPKPSRKTW